MANFLKSGLLKFFAAAALFLLALPCAVAADITALRSWRAPDNTRIVLDLDAPVKYRLSPDSTPARLIVEIDDVQTAGPLALPPLQAPLKSMHFERNGKGQRLVIETTVELSPKIFLLPPNEKYGNRLVLDLYDKTLAIVAVMPEPAAPKAAESRPAEIKPFEAKPAEPRPPELRPSEMKSAEMKPQDTTASKPEAKAETKPDGLEKLIEKTASVKVETIQATPVMPTGPVMKAAAPVAEARPAEKTAIKPAAPEPREKYDLSRYRNVIVAIDAGHGGEDPGASGVNGTHEKHVTLAIARELQSQLNDEPGITAVLTRTGDYFIPLQDRRRIARYQHKADIFISIHADAAENRSARGASVFALSLKGANTATSRFARMLAERENRADLIGGAAIEGGDDILRNVLADMVVAGSLEHSLHMGRNILGGLDNVGRLHSQNVEQAGFAVLKEPGMVSLLVETGFISNPEEEQNLNNKQYQRDLAKAVFNGVRRYCLQYPAPGTYFAWRADKGRALAAEKVSRAADKTDTPKEAAAQQVAAQQPGLVKVEANAPDRAESTPVAVKKNMPKYMKHKVTRGENLTRLASQYQVSMSDLRELNKLRDDNVKVGQVLKIPVN